MNSALPGEAAPAHRIRLWPGVAAVAAQWMLRYGVTAVYPDAAPYAVGGAIVLGLLVLVWWLFFSRLPWLDRLGAVVLMAAAMAVTPRILHRSVATGMMGFMFWIYVIPLLSLALVAAAAITRRLGSGMRLAVVAAAILIACGTFALVRTDGIRGEGGSQFAWRWAKTAEEQLLAGTGAAPPAPRTIPPPAQLPQAAPASQVPAVMPAATAVGPVLAPAAAAVPPAEGAIGPDWPGFRGPHRDGISQADFIETDWAKAPPVEVWRRAVGPGWSSFAAAGGLIYTQEQRGDDEVVACYRAATGAPVWTHRDATRFWESNGGPGPRATPTLSGGRVYTFGATGILNALDAQSGAVVWARNVAADTGAKIPGWGFSGSPLVIADTVIVAAASRLAAYDRATGERRWVVTAGAMSYSSPHQVTLDGVEQVVLLTDDGAASVAPADGKVLWKHAWPGSTILQPALTADGGLLITTGDMGGGAGTRRLAVARAADRWTVEERWTSKGLKPYFNDMVVHKGHAYGFDGAILSCIDLNDGSRKWKGGRYGHGQMLLLPAQDLLLVLSEQGDLALVPAVPTGFSELARFKAMDDKTWNHPVLAGGLLLVRNGREMVAFRLPRAGS